MSHVPGIFEGREEKEHLGYVTVEGTVGRMQEWGPGPSGEGTYLTWKRLQH